MFPEHVTTNEKNALRVYIHKYSELSEINQP